MSDLSITLEALARSAARTAACRSYLQPISRRSVPSRDGAASSSPARATSGTTLAVPEVGDYHALPQEGEGRALVRTTEGVELMSNVCRHRQAVMLRGRGNTRAGTSSARCTAGPTTCTASCWARRTSRTTPACTCNHYPIQPWNGLLFEDGGARRRRRLVAARAAGRRSTSAAMCSTGCTCTTATTTGRPSSRSTSRTTTSAPSIPGWATSSPATTCAGRFGPQHSVQTVGIAHAGAALGKPGSDVYERWHEAVLDQLPSGAAAASMARSGSPTTRR